MSYSIPIIAATSSAALAIVSSELDKVVASQPIHAADRAAAEAAASSLIAILVEPAASQEIAGSISGSVSAHGDNEIVGANLSINLHVRAKQPI